MQKFTKVRSTAETVSPLEIDKYHVTVNTGITEVHEEAVDEEMGGGFDGWEIVEQIIYEKDEYIKMLAEKNSLLAEETTSLQMALVEVYEMMI